MQHPSHACGSQSHVLPLHDCPGPQRWPRPQEQAPKPLHPPEAAQLVHGAPAPPHAEDVCTAYSTQLAPEQHPAQVCGSHRQVPPAQSSPAPQPAAPHWQLPRMQRFAVRWSQTVLPHGKSPPSIIGIAQLPFTQSMPAGHGAHAAPLKPHASFVPPDSHSPLSLQQPRHVMAHVRGGGLGGPDEQATPAAQRTATTARVARFIRSAVLLHVESRVRR
jgi:hypothetical protein